ncbi:hypothetical protein NQ318_007289 [Aromia moschata]|uniref:Uncharacterized protein n=1 Tax=Aromia moschata TaxID=1265417 RepID=A0AAV8Z0G0_9CUCU|nr:hypothetical protein NQ318_007289 [Aromia moschata]
MNSVDFLSTNKDITYEIRTEIKRTTTLQRKTKDLYPIRTLKRLRVVKREPELKLEGRFECQPEYRKAYIDYLIREKRPVDQKQRAFQLVCTDDTSNQEEAKENVSEGEQPVAAANEETNGEVEQSTSHLTVPAIVKDSSSRSSVSSSATSTTKPPTQSAFGPKLSQKKTQRSLTPSPLPHSGRRSRVGSRDVSPQLVPDLAAMPHRRGNLSPSPAARDTSSLERNRWTNASRSDKAFFVLDDRAPRKKSSYQ